MKTESGFTLIELLVVVSIIGLMSSLLLVAIKDMRARAGEAKAAETLHNLRIALEMYYQAHGDWPSSANNGPMVISNQPGSAWNAFYSKITPYMPGFKIDLPYIESGTPSMITQGFIYFKGTENSYVQEAMYNGRTSAYIGCIKVCDGYFFDYNVSTPQSALTLADNGVDPDGIDHLEGHYIVDNTPAGSCSPSSVVY